MMASYLVVGTIVDDANGCQAAFDRALGYPKPKLHTVHYTDVEANLAGDAWRLLIDPDDADVGVWTDGPPPAYIVLAVDPQTGQPIDLATYSAVPRQIEPDDPAWRFLP